MEKGLNTDFIVRICEKQDDTLTILGTGFFLSRKGAIITCYHVIQDCDLENIVAEVDLDGMTLKLQTECIINRINPDKKEDLIILRSKPSQNFKPRIPRLAVNNPLVSDVLMTYGFPHFGHFTSLHSTGSFIGSLSDTYHRNRFQCRFKEVVKGFSGAPVLNLRTGEITGLISSIVGNIKDGRNTETTFVIPSMTLSKFYTSYCREEKLQMANPFDIRDLKPRSRFVLYSLGTLLIVSLGIFFFRKPGKVFQRNNENAIVSKHADTDTIEKPWQRVEYNEDKETSKSKKETAQQLVSTPMPKQDRKTFKYGFVNISGTYLIPARYDSVAAFKYGIAFVKLGAYWDAIDETGKRKTFLNLRRFPKVREKNYFVAYMVYDDKMEFKIFYDYEGKLIMDSYAFFLQESHLKDYLYYCYSNNHMQKADLEMADRVLFMYSDPHERLREFQNLSRSFTELDKQMTNYLLMKAGLKIKY